MWPQNKSPGYLHLDSSTRNLPYSTIDSRKESFVVELRVGDIETDLGDEIGDLLGERILESGGPRARKSLRHRSLQLQSRFFLPSQIHIVVDH